MVVISKQKLAWRDPARRCTLYTRVKGGAPAASDQELHTKCHHNLHMVIAAGTLSVSEYGRLW